MLAVRGLNKHFLGDRTIEAVSDINLEVEAGRFLAIVGRSGSGKSTLLGMIGGISRPTTGTILIDGCNQWMLNDGDHSALRNHKIGFVFQFASLLPTLRAIDNVALPAIVGGALGRHQAYARAHALLTRVGLAERLNSYPGTLSGGEQRRVAIARALINSPQLLLADEPTADLDEETEEEILNLLVDIQQAYKLTMIVVTHNRAIAERADHVLEMSNGKAKTHLQQSAHKTRTEAAVPGNLAESDQAASEIGVQQIFEISAEEASLEQVRLGEGMDRFIGRIVISIIPIVLTAWVINWAIAFCQDRALEAKADAQSAIEEVAMRNLQADIQDIVSEQGNSYKLTINIGKRNSSAPIYVMSPTVRAFVQVGTNWQEVPIKPTDTAHQQVLKITGDQLLNYVIEPDVKGFAELLPYYMHVRITNDMLVSPSSQPKDDLIERNDSYYVYLKPHNVDDKKILSKLHFPGAPPVWIPMPPH
jgi:ABC-type lipoprotein export system ATPase subunit